MTSEEREAKRLARAEARSKEEKLAFWESLPQGERERLLIWFSRQFPQLIMQGPVKKKIENTEEDPLPSLEPIISTPPLSPKIPKEKPPWWKR